MNYIVFDLEFNQAYKDKSETNPRCPFEIIQIGALKLDENLKTIAVFDRLIKPEVYTFLNPFVRDITGISQDQLDISKSFNEVFEEFVPFIESRKSVLCVWGMADIKELFRNIEYHKLDTSLIPKEYINLQAYASKHFNCPAGINIGLSTAVDLLDISLKNQFHDAYNDAYYTAEIFKRIYSEAMKIKLYEQDTQKRLKRKETIKNKVDTYNLIRQFEKMFNREITDEEKKIIKLAYMMGRTNQFQTKMPKGINK